MEHESPTPYAVKCPEHGRVHMSKEEYEAALGEPGGWRCPRCGCGASWDAGNFTDAFGLR